MPEQRKNPGQRRIHIDIGEGVALCGTNAAFMSLSSYDAEGIVCARCQKILERLCAPIREQREQRLREERARNDAKDVLLEDAEREMHS